MPARGPAPDTAGRILDAAELLAQTRGFNGFSYADIGAELGITNAGLHYHFATKADLGRALIARYHEVFATHLRDIDAKTTGAHEKLKRYVGLYRSVLVKDRLCLCGIVAAEHATLPKPMQDEIRRFFTANEVWLAGVLDEGRRRGELRLTGSALEVARLLLGALQGAMLVARSYKSVARFDVSTKRLLADLAAAPPAAAPQRSSRRRKSMA